MFFVAFVPQFLTASAPFLPQVAILEATFVTLAILNSAAYAIWPPLPEASSVRLACVSSSTGPEERC